MARIKKAQMGVEKAFRMKQEKERMTKSAPKIASQKEIKSKNAPSPKIGMKPAMPKKKAAVDSVDSEMFPGKKVAIKDIRRGPYISTNKKKMKDGGKKSFDLNKDGKTTFKDVLIGRGVLPKKAQNGREVMTENKMLDKLRPSEVSRMRGPQGKVDSVGRAKAIKEGMFKEKGGDFFPTSKYMAAKKVGKTSINKMGGKTKSMMHGKGAMKMGGKKSKK